MRIERDVHHGPPIGTKPATAIKTLEMRRYTDDLKSMNECLETF
jgi:hypothetical protein